MADPVWIDNVTPLDSVQMTKLQTRDEKGVSSGYASLGVDGRVPSAQLPPAADLSVYQTRAEKAVANGYASLGADGKVPSAQLPAVATPGGVAYGTSLPASPVDGQEAILVDNVTSPSYHWRFRYNAGNTNADKWEFMGGATPTILVPGTVQTSSTVYTVIDGTTPSFTFSRPGVYECEFGCLTWNDTPGQVVYMALFYAGVSQAEVNVIPLAANAYLWMQRRWRVAVVAGQSFTLTYRVSGGLGSFAYRQMVVSPVRLS